jgi:hypothetical protein
MELSNGWIREEVVLVTVSQPCELCKVAWWGITSLTDRLCKMKLLYLYSHCGAPSEYKTQVV